jgi:hypothetical protein
MGWASFLTVKALDRTPPGLGRNRAYLALKLYYAQLALVRSRALHLLRVLLTSPRRTSASWPGSSSGSC